MVGLILILNNPKTNKLLQLLRVVAMEAGWPTVCPKPPGNTAATPAVWSNGLLQRGRSPPRFEKMYTLGH